MSCWASRKWPVREASRPPRTHRGQEQRVRLGRPVPRPHTHRAACSHRLSFSGESDLYPWAQPQSPSPAPLPPRLTLGSFHAGPRPPGPLPAPGPGWRPLKRPSRGQVWLPPPRPRPETRLSAWRWLRRARGVKCPRSTAPGSWLRTPPSPANPVCRLGFGSGSWQRGGWGQAPRERTLGGRGRVPAGLGRSPCGEGIGEGGGRSQDLYPFPAGLSSVIGRKPEALPPLSYGDTRDPPRGLPEPPSPIPPPKIRSSAAPSALSLFA